MDQSLKTENLQAAPRFAPLANSHIPGKLIISRQSFLSKLLQFLLTLDYILKLKFKKGS